MPDLSEKSFSDIHVISGLLKLYFRSLPIPLITFETYGTFISASSKYHHPMYKVSIHSLLLAYEAVKQGIGTAVEYFVIG